MPLEIKKTYRALKHTAHIRQRANGTYEIRCYTNGQAVSASSKNLAVAKQKFLEKLVLAKNNKPVQKKHKLINFSNYAKKWLEITKKPYIKATTFKSYLQTFDKYIYPEFASRDIKNIKTLQLQSFINKFIEKGLNRTAKKIYQLLNALFSYAQADSIITTNPMQKVKLLPYEQEHGTPLTRKEEFLLLNYLKKNPTDKYAQAFTFLCYTGLRRSELSTVEIVDGWIKCTTGKQRLGKKEKTRKIPISPMLNNVLPLIDVELIKSIHVDSLTRTVKDYCLGHNVHDLRHTFITRCQECGIQRELVSLWAGHSADSSITSLVYTHLEHFEQGQIEEMQKFSYILKF